MSRWAAALRFIGVGWYVGSCIVLGVFGGLWLDKKFNTRPVLVLVGLLLGLVVAFYGMYRMLLPLIKNKHNEEDS
jgi:F0F1-type ATP synthase assembly protein I